MNTAVLTAPREIRIQERKRPELIEPDGVLFRVLQTGICGSDVLAFRGGHKAVAYPRILGHECVGEVLEVGPAVEHVKPGELITIQPQLVCGDCYPCRHGRINVCRNKKFMGINEDGFFTEYYLCGQANVVKLPEGLTRDMGMLVEPFAVGCNAAERAGAERGRNIVVLGAGTIGNCTAQIARANGANVLIADIKEARLRYAKECGIQHQANTSEISLKQAVEEAFGAAGADAMIDCCGVPEILQTMVDCAENASRIVLVGTYERPVTMDMIRLQRGEIDIISVMQYVRRHYLRVFDLMAQNALHLDGFIGKRFPLLELQKAFEYLQKPGVDIMKVAVMAD